ncbi:unnamed protein product [Ilex paraguariensis]|uniref:Uncharacterized protein n=1 Tax=Ilex paraguariensis TaxID=185542 RepID=A0ABC8UPM7_9AQUA
MSQPVEVYPNTVTRQPSSHSNGSFGAVFIVLAVIVVALQPTPRHSHGHSHSHGNGHGHHLKGKQNHGSRPKEGDVRPNHNFQSRDQGDIEFGFDQKRNPTAKMATNGKGKGSMQSGNGEIRGEMMIMNSELVHDTTE